MRGKYVIAGIGCTAFGSLPGRSTISLNVEAVRNALADAGVEKGIVDAVMVKYPTSAWEGMYGMKVAEALGLMPRINCVVDQAGASNAGMISYACMAIEHGQCDVAVVCFADNPKTGSRAAYSRNRDANAVFGWFSTPAQYAMVARRHMGEFGTTHAQLGAIAKAARRHGAMNPAAQLRKPLSIDEYLAVPEMVSPFRRDDCALVSDGAAAVVVMSLERARALKARKPVPILGFGQGHTAWDVSLRPDMTTTMQTVSGATAFKMAGLGPKDIDVAQLYDCFTITPLMTLEDYGFCKKGEGGHFVEDGRIEIGGDLPMNTAGGLLSETGMPGLQMVLEGVRQMRGESTAQVKGAETCIVSNQGGIMHTHSTLIFGGAA
jgi:acetyl-CoA acetyltransferase